MSGRKTMRIECGPVPSIVCCKIAIALKMPWTRVLSAIA